MDQLNTGESEGRLAVAESQAVRSALMREWLVVATAWEQANQRELGGLRCENCRNSVDDFSGYCRGASAGAIRGSAHFAATDCEYSSPGPGKRGMSQPDDGFQLHS